MAGTSPAMTENGIRSSTNATTRLSFKSVDGRDEPGHDGADMVH
jgi:hypothetical protein